jgi:hypothetical protein
MRVKCAFRMACFSTECTSILLYFAYHQISYPIAAIKSISVVKKNIEKLGAILFQLCPWRLAWRYKIFNKFFKRKCFVRGFVSALVSTLTE